MLYIGRKPGEAIIVDGTTRITVIETNGYKVKLGIESTVQVLRSELFEKIQAENRSAAESARVFQNMDEILL